MLCRVRGSCPILPPLLISTDLTLWSLSLTLKTWRFWLTKLIRLRQTITEASIWTIIVTTNTSNDIASTSISFTTSLTVVSPSSSTKTLRLVISNHCHGCNINHTRPFLNGSFFSIEKSIKFLYRKNITTSPYSRTKWIILWWQTIKSNMKQFFIIKNHWYNSQFIPNLLDFLKVHINGIYTFLHSIQLIFETNHTRSRN